MAKVEVGICRCCGRSLALPSTALRSRIRIPCVCGHVQIVRLSATRLQSLRDVSERFAALDDGRNWYVTPLA